MPNDNDSDAPVLRRLRRLVAIVDALTGGEDRRHLLTIESELRTTRADLDRRRGELVQKMNAAGAQFGAVSAYTRCATLGRSASKVPNTAMD
jgi:hypothetical protein